MPNSNEVWQCKLKVKDSQKKKKKNLKVKYYSLAKNFLQSQCEISEKQEIGEL